MTDTSTSASDHLHYVCDMLEQLRVVSASQGAPFLTYLIDMARSEAAMELQRRGGTPSRQKRDASV